MRQVSAISAALAYLPAQMAVMPAPNWHGVFGIARITGTFGGKSLSIIAVGTDAVSGGLVAPSYAVTGGVAATVPVDVFLPGSPPTPFSILHAILLGLGRIAPAEAARVNRRAR